MVQPWIWAALLMEVVSLAFMLGGLLHWVEENLFIFNIGISMATSVLVYVHFHAVLMATLRELFSAIRKFKLKLFFGIFLLAVASPCYMLSFSHTVVIVGCMAFASLITMHVHEAVAVAEQVAEQAEIASPVIDTGGLFLVATKKHGDTLECAVCMCGGAGAAITKQHPTVKFGGYFCTNAPCSQYVCTECGYKLSLAMGHLNCPSCTFPRALRYTSYVGLH